MALFDPIVIHIARQCVGYSWCNFDGDLMPYSCKCSKNYKRFLQLVPEARNSGRDAMASALAARKSKRLLRQVLVDCMPCHSLVGSEMLNYSQYPSNMKKKDVVEKILSAATIASEKCRLIMRQTPDAKSLEDYYSVGASTGKGPKADEFARLLVSKWVQKAKERGFYTPALKKTCPVVLLFNAPAVDDGTTSMPMRRISVRIWSNQKMFRAFKFVAQKIRHPYNACAFTVGKRSKQLYACGSWGDGFNADMTVAEAGLSNKKEITVHRRPLVSSPAPAPVPQPEPPTSKKKRKATAAGMGEARDKLHAVLVTFYQTHNPSKVKIVRKIIDLYMKKHNGDMDVARSAIFTDIKKTYNAIPE